MSASREKKTRSDATYVQRRNHREEDKDRRKHVLYGIAGGVVVVLAIALLVWDSGFFQKRSTAVTIDGENYGPAVVQYYYQTALNTAYYNSMMGASTFDYSVDPAEQVYDEESGQTWRDYLLDQAIDDLTQVTALVHTAESEGYTLPQKDQAYLESQLNSLDSVWRSNSSYDSLSSYLKLNYGSYMDEDTFRQIYADQVLADSYRQHYQDSLTYTDEEAETYYSEHANDLDTFGYTVFTVQATVEEQTDEEGNTVEMTDEEKTAALETAKALEAQCAEARAALPAADREEARRALAGLENERCALRAGMDAVASALARARQDYAAAEAAVTALTAQQTEADEATDLPALESKRDALTARRTALAAQEKALTARLLPNRKAADLYRQHAAARAELERRWQWVNALASTAGGTLSSKQKIRLEAYIQMNYLDAILVHANTRLMQMTAGQYELERVGAENQRSQSGLDLGVIDHYNGTRRSVKTLSGGESFKASLALALGLSDEVQSAAGGIRLDTLFLDEGFGSLDDESLEQAIRVLAGLTEGDRLVGIISHVAALKERIDKQVVVKKARSGGSTVEVIV